MIGPGGFILVDSPICNPNFSFMGEVGKKRSKELNLNLRNIFAGSHILLELL
jgi:hypothetical protein